MGVSWRLLLHNEELKSQNGGRERTIQNSEYIFCPIYYFYGWKNNTSPSAWLLGSILGLCFIYLFITNIFMLPHAYWLWL